MPVIRGQHSFDYQYAAIPNHWLRDNRLSLKAIGLLAQLMSHSVGWQVSVRGLALANKVSRDQIAAALKELETYGYIKRTQTRGDNNRWGEAIYETCDPIEGELPVTEKPLPEKPVTENPTAKKPTNKETNNKETNRKHEYADSFELFWKQYPRKEAKPKAAREFAKLANELGADYLMQQLLIWLSHPSKADRQFWPYAERWLRDRRFDDELPVAGGITKASVKGWFE